MKPNLITLALVVAVVGSGAAHAEVSSVVVRNQSTVVGPEVRLRDIAELSGPLAGQLGQFVVTVLRDEPSGAGATTIRLADIERFITTRDINQGKVTIRGFATCTVQRFAAATQPVAETAAAVPSDDTVLTPTASSGSSATLASPAAPAVANPAQGVDRNTAGTVRERVIDLVERIAGVGREDLRITFNNDDSKTLAMSVLQDKWEFQPTASVVPGKLPLIVRKLHGTDVVGTYRVNVDVARRYLAVVAKTAIARGTPINSGDVEVREVWVGNAATVPATDLKAVVGNVSNAALRPGAIVTAAAIQPAVMVKRGDLVKVRVVAAGIMLSLDARAMEEGAIGQTIQLRNEKTRDTLAARVTAPGQATLVTASDSPDPSAAPTATPAANATSLRSTR